MSDTPFKEHPVDSSQPEISSPLHDSIRSRGSPGRALWTTHPTRRRVCRQDHPGRHVRCLGAGPPNRNSWLWQFLHQPSSAPHGPQSALVLTIVPLLPGRGAPPPPKRKRQRHSATDAWDYVAGRDGTPPLDSRAARQAHRGKRGRHTRARGSGVPAWKLDEVTFDPDEQVVPRPIDPPTDDAS